VVRIDATQAYIRSEKAAICAGIRVHFHAGAFIGLKRGWHEGGPC